MATWSIHHTSLAVGDADASLKFYRDGLGLKVVNDVEEKGERLSRQIELPEAWNRLIWLATAEGETLVELLEYKNPRGKKFDLNCADIGSPHISFLVDDIGETYEKLAGMGYRPTTEPLSVDETTQPGAKTVYFYDPDGIVVELFQIADARREKKIFY